MNNNNFIKHLKKGKAINKDIAIAHTKKLYLKTAFNMQLILNQITCVENIDYIYDNVGELIYYISEDCCTIEFLAKILEHDYRTHTHSVNVSIYALFFGQFLKFSQEDLIELGISALLHDLGKSKIDLNIINKNGKLSELEFAYMKKHPLLGYEIARKFGIKSNNILLGIRNHHERVDGAGYPDNLTIHELKIFPKIIAICDIFDALTTKRSYKNALSSYEAFKLMKKDNYHLDPILLKRFIEMMSKKSHDR